MAALHGHTTRRASIVRKLLKCVRGDKLRLSPGTLLRCLDLRAWDLAEELLRSQGLELAAHKVLAAPGPSDLDFRGYTPLHILWTEPLEDPRDTSRFIDTAAMTLRRSGAHGSAACGDNPYSCLELLPRFVARTVHSNGLEFFDELEGLLEVWHAHLPASLNPQGRLLPMLDAVIRKFGASRAENEKRPWETEQQREIALNMRSRSCVDLAFMLPQVFHLRSLDALFDILLFDDPFLQDEVAIFRTLLLLEYGL